MKYFTAIAYFSMAAFLAFQLNHVSAEVDDVKCLYNNFGKLFHLIQDETYSFLLQRDLHTWSSRFADLNNTASDLESFKSSLFEIFNGFRGQVKYALIWAERARLKRKNEEDANAYRYGKYPQRNSAPYTYSQIEKGEAAIKQKISAGVLQLCDDIRGDDSCSATEKKSIFLRGDLEDLYLKNAGDSQEFNKRCPAETLDLKAETEK